MQSPVTAAVQFSLRQTFTRQRLSWLRILPLLFAAACSHNSTDANETTDDAASGPMNTLDASAVTETERPNDETQTSGHSSASSTRPTNPSNSTNASTAGNTKPTTTTSESNATSSQPNEGSATADPTSTSDGTTSEAATTTSTSTSNVAPEPGSGPSIRDGELFVDGAPFRIRGVNWNPVPVGATHPQGLDYPGSAVEDAPLMQAAGINAVRTYEHLDDSVVLDALYEHGIYVFTTVYGWWQDDPSVVTARVNAVKSHPAVLGYVLGNEWNYNHLYGEGSLSTIETRDKINAAAALVKQADPDKLVCTIYGELGELGSMIDNMPDIDMWGINAYRGIGFGDLFDKYAELSNKPMFLGEFGADAYNADIDAYDPASQAEATSALIGEISIAFDAGQTVGGSSSNGTTNGGRTEPDPRTNKTSVA